MGKNARALVEREFSADEHYKKLINIYNQTKIMNLKRKK